MVYEIIFCPKFPDIPDKAGRNTRKRRRIQAIAKRFAFHVNAIEPSQVMLEPILGIQPLNDQTFGNIGNYFSSFYPHPSIKEAVVCR